MAKSKNHLDISVLIATYNRAEILRRTLDSMIGLERDGLSVEFVVVDNNSSDHTKEVIESFIDRLPIRYLFEPRPGKNCALNKALKEVPLGKLVAFTDDDVTPARNWLRQIIAATHRWPKHEVFGGRIRIHWPNAKPPEWANARWIQVFGYALHDFDIPEQPYEGVALPFGPNFWTRKSIFESGYRYNEGVGPHPTNRIMGSETTFLKRLAKDAYEVIWCPEVEVEHRIQASELNRNRIRQRGFRFGRGKVHLNGISRPQQFSKSPRVWAILETILLCATLARYVLARMRLDSVRRVHSSVGAAKGIGFHFESLKQRHMLSEAKEEEN